MRGFMLETHFVKTSKQYCDILFLSSYLHENKANIDL